MALSGDAIRSWAKGSPADAAHPAALQKPGAAGAPKKHPLLDDGTDEAPQEGEAEKNPIWAGEKGPEEITPQDADELIDWLEQNEPEIHDAVMELAKAVAEGDDNMVQHATDELQQATQYLNPEYPPLDETERHEASGNIAKHITEAGHPPYGSPEHKQAVAIGLSEARAGKAHGGASGKASKGGHMAPGGPDGGAPPGGLPGAMGSKPMGRPGAARPMGRPGIGPPHTSFGSLKG